MLSLGLIGDMKKAVKNRIERRLKIIEGQVRGLQKRFGKERVFDTGIRVAKTFLMIMVIYLFGGTPE